LPRLLIPSSDADSPGPGQGAADNRKATPLTDASQFAWEGPAGVTRLRVAADSSTSATPSFDVYTNENAVNATVFVPPARLSRSEASYRVQVTHLGPFSTVDAALASTGIATLVPSELRTSTSDEAAVLTVPAAPPGAVVPAIEVPAGADRERAVPWAPCQYPPGTELACGGGTWFSLTAINNRLRHFPEFAFAVHIHCVTSCAEARAFASAEEAYSKAHPDFPSSEPLDLPR